MYIRLDQYIYIHTMYLKHIFYVDVVFSQLRIYMYIYSGKPNAINHPSNQPLGGH